MGAPSPSWHSLRTRNLSEAGNADCPWLTGARLVRGSTQGARATTLQFAAANYAGRFHTGECSVVCQCMCMHSSSSQPLNTKNTIRGLFCHDPQATPLLGELTACRRRRRPLPWCSACIHASSSQRLSTRNTIRGLFCPGHHAIRFSTAPALALLFSRAMPALHVCGRMSHVRFMSPDEDRRQITAREA